MALLILWAPVWFRSSRLSRTRAPTSADSLGAGESGVGRPTYSLASTSKSCQKAGSERAES